MDVTTEELCTVQVLVVLETQATVGTRQQRGDSAVTWGQEIGRQTPGTRNLSCCTLHT